MKGIINKGIQELVETQFGAEVWEKIRTRARCKEPFCAASENYPDEMTMALVAAASEISGLPPDDILVEFDRFVVPHTFREAYPSYFELAGRSAREFLRNMNRVHDTVTRNSHDASPPRFECEDLPDGRLRLHYHSDRGLCQAFRGLVLEVGISSEKVCGSKSPPVPGEGTGIASWR